MLRLSSVVFLLLLLLLAAPARSFEYWNHIRNSATLPVGQVTIRVENPTGAGVENYLLYAQNGVIAEEMVPIIDGPSTVEATVPGPGASRRYYGFRLLEGNEIAFLPVWLAAGADPAPQDLTLLATDPVGDDAFDLENLDLTECRVSFDGSRLYAALKNAGGGFPQNQGFTFYGYLLGIANPVEINPSTVFALLYTIDQPGIINPGLYRIFGDGISDLEQIGEVTITEFPAQNTLLLSCNFADLLADSEFSAWYDPQDPAIGVGAFTQKITIFGAEEADRSPGGTCYLRELGLDPIVNHLPELTNPFVSDPGPNALAQVVYSDPDGHCPVIAEIVVDDTSIYPLFPQSLDYTNPVTYRSATGIPELVAGNWLRVVFRFSDNETNIVTTEMTITSIDDEPFGSRRSAWVSGWPNPASGQMAFRVDLAVESELKLTIHDLAGRTIAVIAAGHFAAGHHGFAWDGRDQQGRRQPAGVYFYRLQSPDVEVSRRITFVH